MAELKSIQEFEQWLVSQNKIYLYGAARLCDKLIKKIQHMGLRDSVQSILLSDVSLNFKTLFGISATKFNANEIDPAIPILLAVVGPPQKEIAAYLQQQNITHFVLLSNDFENQLNEELNRLETPELKEYIYSYSKHKSGQPQKDILFLSPPYWDFHSPFSAVPCLAAELKQHGYSVAQYDIGIHCIHNLIREKWKESAEQCLTKSFYNTTFKNYNGNVYSSYEEYKNDMWFFQTKEFDVSLVKDRYFELNAVQKRVLEAFYSRIYFFDLTNIDFDKCKNLDSAINRWYSRNMLDTLCTEELKQIFTDIPNVVGISITSTCQFIPGCILAELVKKCRPDAKIILGGSCADLFANSSYPHKADIKKYFDYIIVGEGETALVGLMRYFDGKADINTVPNLMFIDSDDKIRYSEQIVEDVTRLPAPDYDGLNLDLYLSPKLILPYQTSRGCHYGYCAFCNHNEKYRHNYRTKQMDVVVNDLLSLSAKYKNACFQFVDEAVRPDCFKDMIEEMDKHPEFKDMKWFYYSRVSRQYDEELLRRAHNNGCEMVMFGVESFNQRLLNFIKKGITADTSKYCLELFHKCGIKTYAWLLCNLPSETLEEAQGDLEDVKQMQDHMNAFSVGAFRLERNTDMYDSPEKYNITSIDQNDPSKFQSHKDGVPIDKNSILNFWTQKYLRYQTECHALGNRYTVFFE